MTEAQFEMLKPGDVIRSRRSGRLRTVLQANERAVLLVKIGWSWTSPRNPTTTYLKREALKAFEVTGRRLAWSRRLAALRNWHGRGAVLDLGQGA